MAGCSSSSCPMAVHEAVLGGIYLVSICKENNKDQPIFLFLRHSMAGCSSCCPMAVHKAVFGGACISDQKIGHLFRKTTIRDTPALFIVLHCMLLGGGGVFLWDTDTHVCSCWLLPYNAANCCYLVVRLPWEGFLVICWLRSFLASFYHVLSMFPID